MVFDHRGAGAICRILLLWFTTAIVNIRGGEVCNNFCETTRQEGP